MERIKDNALSLVAIILSFIAINLSLRFEPFVFTESALNWVLGIVVAIVGVAVSVALVTQIWTAINIAPMIEKKMKYLKAEMEFTSHTFYTESMYHMNSMDTKKAAYEFLSMGVYNMAIHSFVLSITILSRCKDLSFCQSEIDDLTDKINEWKLEKTPIELNSNDKKTLIDKLDIPKVSVAKLIYAISTISTNDKLPVIDETVEYYQKLCEGCPHHS